LEPGGAVGLGGSRRVKALPWEQVADRDETVNAGSVTTDQAYTYSLGDLAAKHGHKQKYNDLIRRRTAVRDSKGSRAGHRLAQWDDMASLGMEDGKQDMEGPKLEMPAAEDDLWMQRPIGTDGKPIVRPGAVRHSFD